MIRGLDCSHHNGIVDWTEEKRKGIEFCFLKATEGTGFTDSRFDFNSREAPKAGILTGAYHFFHSNLDPVEQANHFLKVIGPMKTAVLDWEVSDGMRAPIQKARAQRFLEIIQRAEKTTLLYASPGFLQGLGDLSAFAKYPWWCAEYGVTSPRIVKPFDHWTFWQYSDSGGRDVNLFYGTEDQLKTYF